jgi:hypothetical protein
MYRRAPLLFFKAARNRSWKKDAKGAAPAAAHFADLKGVKGVPQPKMPKPPKVDTEPGGNRFSNDSSKPVPVFLQRMFNVKNLGPLRSMADWAATVRLQEWRHVALPLYPTLWGVGIGCTSAIVIEGADLIALNCPFLPLHLVGTVILGALSVTWSSFVYQDLLDRFVRRRALHASGVDVAALDKAAVVAAAAKAEEERNGSKMAAQSDGMMHVVKPLGTNTACSALSLQVGLAFMAAMNLHPTAFFASACITPFAVLYPVAKRVIGHDTRWRLFGLQLYQGMLSTSGIFIGYLAILGRVDPAVTLPLWGAAIAWTIIYDTVHVLTKEEATSSPHQAPFLSDKPKAVLLVCVLPLVSGLLIGGYTAGQSVLFHAGVLFAGLNMIGIIEHVNVNDPWSCRNAYKRLVRFGGWIVLVVCCGNAGWAIVMALTPAPEDGEHEVKEFATTASSSTLVQVLSVNVEPMAQQFATATDIPFMDRLLKPVLVYTQIMAERGVTDYEVPVYMRREFFGQNCAELMHHLPLAQRTVDRLEASWYKFADHYNIFSRVM